MLKGDLVSTPLPTVLRQLADGVASGCLHVSDGVGEEAKVYFRGGQVYAVQVPGRRPQLGARLVSSGSLGPEALAEALEAQRTELQGWRLGELLVHLGYVDQPVVEAFINEQVREQTSDLIRWPTGTWKFRVNERTREDVAPPTSVEVLLDDVAHRMAQWETITELLHGPDAVPMLSAAGQSDSEMAIDPEAWSLLCKVDGHRSVAELAGECGFTLFEAGQVVYALVRSGLLEVEEVLVGAESAAPSGSVASRLAAAFAPAPAFPAEPDVVTIPAQAEEPSPADMASLISAALREDRTAEALAPLGEDEITGSIDRVSQALSALLGPTTDESLFAAPKPRTPKVKPLTPAEQERAAKKAERAALDAKRRGKDAAELAAAQADLEAGRRADAAEDAAAFAPDHEAEIVSLADVRREAARRDEEEAEAAQLAEQARLAELAAEEEAARLAAEAEAEAAQLAAEEEAARLAAEAEAEAAQLAAEDEAARLAELAAEEEAARLAADAEAAQLAAEEEAARHAAEEARFAAAEQARLEELAAEEEARVAAEAVATEEARLAEIAAQEEAERVAAEQAAAAAEEEARFAAAEQARLVELAAEQEAARLAELAAEDEAARVAQQQADRARVEAELRLAVEEQEVAAAAAAEAQAAAQASAEDERRATAQAAADAEQDEQLRLTLQRAEASSAFAELSAAAASSSDVQVLEVDASAVEEPGFDDQPVYKAPDTDMASLFRELSSLGMEDAPDPPVRPAGSAPRPVTPTVPVKKKKGLFGR